MKLFCVGRMKENKEERRKWGYVIEKALKSARA